MDPKAILATLRAHEFLNIRFMATPEEAKAAYITLMKMYHPDKNPRYADRATWICQMIADARDQTLARNLVRGFPKLEHYIPVLGDPGPDLCECGEFRKTEEPVCLRCGSMDLPKTDTPENRERVWKFTRLWARNQRANSSVAFNDWDLACKIFNKHFGR